MNIIIKKHLLLYKGYKLKCSIGKSGMADFKKEGDLATPKGVFELGLLYFRKDRIKLNKFYFDFENNLDEDKYYLSSFYLKDKNETSDKENLKSDYYEISNFQQLSALIKKEFKMIKMD